MKMPLRQIALVLLAGLWAARAARLASLRSSRKSDESGQGAGGLIGADMAMGQMGTKASVSAMVGEMLEGTGPKVHDIIASASRKMNMEEAMRQLDGKLPDEVASLVRLSAQKGAKTGDLDEDSMQKARGILNNMISEAWLELDDVVFECKEFQERNRGTYEQVVNDLSRLGSQLAGLGERRVSAASGITSYDAQRKGVEILVDRSTQQFSAKRYENQQELTRRKNDLAVFDFILNLTACPADTSQGSQLVQIGKGKASHSKMTICSAGDGIHMNLSNPQLQAQVERMMTPAARMALRSALGQASSKLSLLQVGSGLANDTFPTQVAAEMMPVQEEPHPEGQWKKCIDGEENCGLLHDLMSLEWGKFRDEVDELTAEMTTNQQAYDIETNNFNEQLTVIGDAKTKHMETLAEAISNINADTEEMNEKDEQKRDLTHEYDKMCAEFRAKITEILFTKMCAVRKVRNGLLIHSQTSPPPAISDCDVTDWAPKTGECHASNGQVILCDDTCPREDPYLCGGKEEMKREIVVIPNSYGIVCPPLDRLKRCGQKKCPVTCSMSQWSGWSKCSKECESGVQSKTRSILVKAKNGGRGCDSVQEERACNTGSCDRDCTLKDWTDWAPCSMACGGGFTTRKRKVLVPIRGQGKCPTESARQRLEEQTCNSQACVGDEICVAQQDLIIALDASGSLKVDGFDILRTFAVNLTQRYEAKYFGLDAVKIGVTLFGNGHLMTMPDGTVSITPAINVQPLTSDFDLVRTKLREQTWQRGFTNMAQALTLADTMLTQGGRESAQSAVLVLSDGRYSFKYQTAEKARELKDKNIQVFMAPVTDFEGKELSTLQSWASQPWETNYERIPGLAALKYNAEIFVQKFVAKFCPDSMSPSLLLRSEEQQQFMLIHENGWPSDECGTWYWEGTVNSKDDCAAKARARHLSAFSFGRSYAAGRCYSEAVAITEDFWNTYSAERRDPPCPSGTWLYNPFYDTYAINPTTV